MEGGNPCRGPSSLRPWSERLLNLLVPLVQKYKYWHSNTCTGPSFLRLWSERLIPGHFTCFTGAEVHDLLVQKVQILTWTGPSSLRLWSERVLPGHSSTHSVSRRFSASVFVLLSFEPVKQVNWVPVSRRFSASYTTSERCSALCVSMCAFTFFY